MSYEIRVQRRTGKYAKKHKQGRVKEERQRLKIKKWGKSKCMMINGLSILVNNFNSKLYLSNETEFGATSHGYISLYLFSLKKSLVS